MEFKDKKNLPGESGVYVFVKDEEPIYIGYSNFLRMRMYCHNKKDVIRKADECRFYKCKESKAKYVESKLIKKLNPRYNEIVPKIEITIYREGDLEEAVRELGLKDKVEIKSEEQLV